MENTNKEYRALSKAQRIKAFFRFQTYNQSSFCFDRAYVNGWTNGVLPTLEYLYEGRPEELKAALLRTRDYWLSQEYFAMIPYGIYLSMEEQYANGAEFDPDLIREIKSSLMGPLSGMGDSIFGATIRQISMLIFLPYALEGAVWAPILWGLIYVYCISVPVAILFLETGYKYGKEAVGKLLGTPWLNALTKCAGLASMMIMGAMTSKYTTFALKYTFESQGQIVVLQDKIDAAVPGLLVLIATFIYYGLVGKKVKFIYMVLGTFVICLGLALIGLI